jgi:hypothetical protein
LREVAPFDGGRYFLLSRFPCRPAHHLSVGQLKKEDQMQRKTWVYDPQSGGIKIPLKIQPLIRQRILQHAAKHYAGKYNRIEVRFRGQFCYIDAYTEPYVPKNHNAKLYGVSREAHIERIYAASGTLETWTAGQWHSTLTATRLTSPVSSPMVPGMERRKKLSTPQLSI